MCSGQLFKEQKKIWKVAKGTASRWSSRPCMVSCVLCKFICQMKVLDAERLRLLSEVTQMKNETRRGSSQGSVSCFVFLTTPPITQRDEYAGLFGTIC